MKLLPSGVRRRVQRCKKSSIAMSLATAALVTAFSGCAETPRTATNFCRVLAERIDDITTPPTSNAEVQELIGHYDRLVEVAPIEVEDDLAAKRYPQPRTASGRDEVFVGRIREDISCPNGIALWCVSDNLRKGAATNAVQIAEYLAKHGLKGAGHSGRP